MSKELNKYFKSEPVEIPRSSVRFAHYNPRKITDSALKKLKQNIKRVGMLGGIVWNERTANLVSGHMRVSVLDQLNGYDGTKETDYILRVDKVNLSEKEEKEQNIFMNNQSVQGEFDLDILRDILPDIDYKSAGLTDQDLSLIGIELDMPQIDDILADFEGISSQYNAEREREKKANEMKKEERIAHNKEVKAIVKESAQKQAENMDAYVMLSFDTYEAKASFCERFGYDPDMKFIKGEVFDEQIERID